jgi:hypothetical protein
LGRLQPPREFLLRKTGSLPQGGKLQRHVPGIAGPLEAFGKRRVSHLLGEVAIKIRFLHCLLLS